MANNKMLIDASHPEETRVAVVRGNRVEEFDFESQAKKQLRGNIYLAKVTRVEPSLQAAFVDYGGNRHGFLAFSEIHPDYYQIPMADRQALLEEEAREANEEAEEEENERNGRRRRPRRGDKNRNRGPRASDDAALSDDDHGDEHGEDGDDHIDAGSADNGDDEVDEHEMLAADANDARNDEHDENGDDDGADGKPSSIAAAVETDSISEPAPEPDDAEDAGDAGDSDGEAAAEEKPKRKRRAPAKPRKTKKQLAEEAAAAEAAAEAGETAEAMETDASEEVSADTSSDEPEAGAEDEAADTKGRSERSSRGRRTSRSSRSKRAAEPVEAAQDTGESDDADDNGNNVGDGSNGRDGANSVEEDEQVESVGQEDAMEEVPYRRKLRRQYKIQEVIKRRQIMLVQVVKEERGNKGAALTTYLSLAGRYSVLMPNTARGGGISRKITNSADRKRLKEIAGELEVPQGMGVILRTAGASRTKPEVKRDFEYLMRLWENVRNLTLSSSAPCLVYEEGSLIKRSIRDLYDKDTGEIIVSGEEGYREAKDFMRMLMPSHAKHVKQYVEPQAIFSRFGVEQQLDRLLLPQVTLRSGGYIVINQTEALVSIDVNSGRSTREHSIEDTAVQTNLEAADEVARQLRLRDLAGLIVIDFIDMEENRNNRAVEKRLKEALKNDRARIQVGRISHFGLMEMSRQRIRASVMESTMEVCPHCQGLGHVRSHSSIALHVFRAIEEHLTRNPRHDVIARCPFEIALDILNHKRASLIDLEDRFGVVITVQGDPALPGQSFHIERGEAATRTPRKPVHVVQGAEEDEEDEDLDAYADEMADVAEAEAETESRPSRDGDEDRSGRKKRRRRRRGGRRDGADGESRDASAAEGDDDDQMRDGDSDGDESQGVTGEAGSESDADGEERARRKRRRGKRGGRKNRGDGISDDAADGDAANGDAGGESDSLASDDHDAQLAETEAEDASPSLSAGAAEDGDEHEAADEVSEADAPVETGDADDQSNAEENSGRRRNTRRPRVQSVAESVQANKAETVSQPAGQDAAPEAEEAKAKPKKGGWWSRGGGFF
ncbi:MAG: Rne/Rng family ribonuclease [Nitratireductor sp.]